MEVTQLEGPKWGLQSPLRLSRTAPCFLRGRPQGQERRQPKPCRVLRPGYSASHVVCPPLSPSHDTWTSAVQTDSACPCRLSKDHDETASWRRAWGGAWPCILETSSPCSRTIHQAFCLPTPSGEYWPISAKAHDASDSGNKGYEPAWSWSFPVPCVSTSYVSGPVPFHIGSKPYNPPAR